MLLLEGCFFFEDESMLHQKYFKRSSNDVISLEDQNLVYSEEGFLKSLRTTIFGLTDKEKFLTLYFQLQNAKALAEFKENMNNFSDSVESHGSAFKKIDSGMEINRAKLKTIFAHYVNEPVDSLKKEIKPILNCLKEVDKLLSDMDSIELDCLKKGNFRSDKSAADFLNKENWDNSKIKMHLPQIVKDNDAAELITISNTARRNFRKYFPDQHEMLTFQYVPYNPNVFPYGYIQNPSNSVFEELQSYIRETRNKYPKDANSIFSFVY